MSVTCPTLLTISFAEYIETRIRPTGAMYDPATDMLQLANAAIVQEVANSKAQELNVPTSAAPPPSLCCTDSGDVENCNGCVFEPE